MKRRSIAAGLLAAALLSGAALGHAATTVTGAVTAPLVVDEALLKSLPQVTVSVSFQTDHGAEKGTYTGAALWDVLQKAGLVNAPGKNTVLRHSVLVTGSDGYEAALAIGEIAPDLEAKHVILAYEAGKPPALQDLRLVVPGDAHGGRSVKDVVTIEVK